jgi:actin-related protein
LSIHQSLQEIVKSAVSLAPESDRIALYQSVVLAGGATKMPGLAQRLQHELLGVVPDGTRVTVVAPAERQWSAWCGASRLGARPSFQEYWVPKQLYEEIHYIFSVAKYVH